MQEEETGEACITVLESQRRSDSAALAINYLYLQSQVCSQVQLLGLNPQLLAMRLHILGPAFGLPSIDAECIAAVALVKLYCQSTEQTYELVASYETSDEARLPLLEDGATARSGYGAISRYLTDSAGNISGLASDLAREQRGHAVA